MNKKGDVFSIFILLVILLAVALLGLLFTKMTLGATDILKNTPIINDTEKAKDATEKIETASPYVADGFILFLFLGGVIGLIIAAVSTDFSPAIIFVFILLLIIGIFVASGFTNIYQGFTDDATLSSTANKLAVTDIIFSKYTPLIIGVLGMIILIVMYSKTRSEAI